MFFFVTKNKYIILFVNGLQRKTKKLKNNEKNIMVKEEKGTIEVTKAPFPVDITQNLEMPNEQQSNYFQKKYFIRN